MFARTLTWFAVLALPLGGQGCDCSQLATVDGGPDLVGEGEGEGEGEGDLCAAFVPRIAVDTTMYLACSPYVLGDHDLEVTDSATLTIEAGVDVRFDAGHWLEVTSGTLIAAGTSAAPITLTGAAGASARSWIGVILRDGTQAGTELRHVDISGAGQDGFGTASCLHIVSDSVANIAIEDSRFADCPVGVAVDGEPFEFAAFSRNTFSATPVGVDVPPAAVGQIDATQTYSGVTENRIQEYPLVQTATWHGQGVPFVLAGSISVGQIDGAVLTLGEGVVLRFPPGAFLEVGYGGVDGGLVAVGSAAAPVVFESTLAAPAAGSWVGIVFRPDTMDGSTLDHAVVRHAGEEMAYFSHAAVSLYDTGDAVSIDDTIFSENENADIYLGCGATIGGNSGNTTPTGVVTAGPC